MTEAPPTLGRGMRWLLLFCGPMNAAGAVCFSPPFPAVRRAFGLAEPPAFYLWLISAWILAFGVAYFWQGWTGRADRGVLSLGAWGKGVFAGLLVGMAAVGEAPPLTAAAVWPDLALAVVFAVWLWRSRRPRAVGDRQVVPPSPSVAPAQGG